MKYEKVFQTPLLLKELRRPHQNVKKFVRTHISISFLSSQGIIEPLVYLERESCSDKTQFPLNSVLFENNLGLSCSKGYVNESSLINLVFGYLYCLYSVWQLYLTIKQIFSKYNETLKEINSWETFVDVVTESQ